MAKNIFVYRDSEGSSDSNYQSQIDWIDENGANRQIFVTEKSSDSNMIVIVNEEDDAIMCGEYKEEDY